MTQTHTNTPSPGLTWSAPKRANHTRSTLWYICSAIVLGLLITWSIYDQSWTFTTVLILGGILYLWTHRKPEKEHTITLREDGVVFAETFSPWDACEGFYILDGPGYFELNIAFKNTKKDNITIRTGDIDPYQIQAILSQVLPVLQDRREKVLDTITRICKL